MWAQSGALICPFIVINLNICLNITVVVGLVLMLFGLSCNFWQAFTNKLTIGTVIYSGQNFHLYATYSVSYWQTYFDLALQYALVFHL